jgi:zinc/manganese transport system substrate-binding protein
VRPKAASLTGLAAVVLVAVAGCSTAGSSTSAPSGASGPASKVIQVVAAENFWGSIAAQLGGRQVKVTNIIDNPDADPHDYEPTAADGRAIASADVVLINGIGYDVWATKLADANPNPARSGLTVGQLIGVANGGNPHRWYNPDDVHKVVDQIVGDYTKIDPADSAYFQTQKTAFETTATAGYRAVIAEIKSKYAGTPVGASESIFAMIAPALGLDVLTPANFLTAVSQGTDPTAADKSTIDAQITGKKIKMYVYNSQNATPDVQRQVEEAKAAGIPISTITETMTPATASWQQWQTAQLVALRDALAKAAA